MVTTAELVTKAKSLFPDSETARLDTEVLLGFVTKQTRAQLLTHADRQLTDDQTSHWQELLRRRKSGEPVAYLLGSREFYSLPIKVNRNALIPRPETELLVDLALRRLADTDTPTVLELGTGSGAISCAIAHNRPNAKILATDISEQALAIARGNTKDLDVTNVRFLNSDWFFSLEKQQFDLIIANPPYVAEDDDYLQKGDVRFEPECALVAGSAGLDCFEAIVPVAQDYLKAGAFLMLEHGPEQGQAIRKLFSRLGYENIKTHTDLAGLERVSLAQRNN